MLSGILSFQEKIKKSRQHPIKSSEPCTLWPKYSSFAHSGFLYQSQMKSYKLWKYCSLSPGELVRLLSIPWEVFLSIIILRTEEHLGSPPSSCEIPVHHHLPSRHFHKPFYWSFREKLGHELTNVKPKVKGKCDRDQIYLTYWKQHGRFPALSSLEAAWE